MNDRKIGKIIEQAKTEAEEFIRRKKDVSRAPGVDVRDIFSDEELARMLSENDRFAGRVVSMSKMERYKYICTMAAWLDKNSFEVIKTDSERPSSTKPNAVVVIDVRRLASFRDEELEKLTTAMGCADSVFLSGINEDCIRFTFGVENIWEK